MRFLVTGGAGFIGSNFVHHLFRAHPRCRVTVLDKLTYAGNPDNLRDLRGRSGYRFVRGDICDRRVVEKLVGGCDVVVNFAAETHVDRSILEAGAFVRTDVYGTFVLLEAVRKRRGCRFLQISTDEVYGEAGATPPAEDAPLMPRSPYAASKAGADRLAFSYWATYGTPVVITRCTNNYGPYQFPEKLVPLFATNAIMSKPLPIYGSGTNTRDWIHVLDHCRALDAVIHGASFEGEVYNIGAGEEHSVLEIADIVLETLEKPADLISHVADRPGHVVRHAVDTKKIRSELRWSPVEDFRSALAETVRWYRDNEGWWRGLLRRRVDFAKRFARARASPGGAGRRSRLRAR
ncbi:MAG: dTDP-glucose 4,6-dehydratase [Thermoplasmatota archaeon]